MNQDFNFKQEYNKAVKMAADYGMSLAYARHKYQPIDLLFTWDIDLPQRKKNYLNLMPLIEELKEKFQQLVATENRLYILKGFPSQIEFYLTRSGIPREKYDYFLKNIDRFVKIIHADFPMTEEIQKLEEKGIGEWNEFIAPYAEGYIGFTIPFHSLNEIVDAVSKYDREFKKNKERIKIVERDKKLFFKTKYLVVEDVVEVQIDKNVSYGTHKSLHLVFLLGIALAMLKHTDKGEDTNHLPRYVLAQEANKFTLNFVKTQTPERIQKYFRYNLLRTITFALFAIDIYTNDHQDFDQAFARAVNRCYLKANQTKNPFYVFVEPITLMEDLMESINYIELYLQDEKNVHTNKNL